MGDTAAGAGGPADGEWEPNNAVWGRNYPVEYESYLRTRITDTKTRYGGSFPRDYLEADPRR